MDAAKSTDGSVYNGSIMQVTAPGPGKQVVYTYPAGMAALAAGHQIQYVGASGPILFNSVPQLVRRAGGRGVPCERAGRGGRDDQPGSGAGPQWLTGQAMLTVQALGFGVVSAALIAIGAMGFTLQFGLTNVLNISYGGAMTVGAFAAFIAAELAPAGGGRGGVRAAGRRAAHLAARPDAVRVLRAARRRGCSRW